MAIANTIEAKPTAELNLDPKNPRLRDDQHNLSQPEILEVMLDWSLDELAESIIENGFWPHEALIIVEEALPNERKKSLVVVEGNRRLAAVVLLLSAKDGRPRSNKWRALADRLKATDANKLRSLPTVRVDSREDVDAYLGFRHVTGIKEWEPHEKATFIAKLIDSGLSYETVMRKIGSKTQAVRQSYIAQKLFGQLSELDGVDADKVRSKFSVLYLSLRAPGTQKYLGLDLQAEPKKARAPLQAKFQSNAVRYARWLFGDATHLPLVPESRYVDKFGTLLESDEAVAYLERNEEPRFEVAVRLAGGDLAEIVQHIERAADEVEEVLGVVHRHSTEREIKQAVARLYQDVDELRTRVPIRPEKGPVRE